MPPRHRPHPLMVLLIGLALILPLTGRLQAPLVAAELRLPHAAWSFDMRIGPVRFRTGAFESGQFMSHPAARAIPA